LAHKDRCGYVPGLANLIGSLSRPNINTAIRFLEPLQRIPAKVSHSGVPQHEVVKSLRIGQFCFLFWFLHRCLDLVEPADRQQVLVEVRDVESLKLALCSPWTSELDVAFLFCLDVSPAFCDSDLDGSREGLALLASLTR